MRYKRPRGTQDILPAQMLEWRLAEETFRCIADNFGYSEIRTPIFEETDLFVRSVGADTDIVSKEMYTFQDRGGRSLTLRPEGTAPVVRAFLENNLQGTDPGRVVKLFYIAPVFRYDRPQAGRYRQHHQAGIEALGSPAPALDAEVMHLAWVFYHALGLEHVDLLVNSVGCPVCRPGYIEKLRAYLAAHVGALCVDCQRRYEANPLRILDCKNPACRKVTESAPAMLDALCSECAAHFAAVRSALASIGIPYQIQPRIVRGLDYYTKTAFEFVAPGLGAQDALGGGGRYDGLVEACGGPPTPGVGLGIGLERVLLARQALGLSASAPKRRGVFVISIGEAAAQWAVGFCARLRAAGTRADLDYRFRSLRAQLRHADAAGFRYAAIVGDDELGRGEVTLRDLETGEQESIPADDTVKRLSSAAGQQPCGGQMQ